LSRISEYGNIRRGMVFNNNSIDKVYHAWHSIIPIHKSLYLIDLIYHLAIYILHKEKRDGLNVKVCHAGLDPASSLLNGFRLSPEWRKFSSFVAEVIEKARNNK
jgi:hypothetical protein